MKRTFVKYYFLFALLIPELKVLAQLENNYSSAIAQKQSELFPNKFIFSGHKYVYNKQRLKQNETCLLLKEKNDKEINLQLQDARSNRKASKRGYIIGITTAIAGIAFIASGDKYIWDHDTYNYFTNTGHHISKEELAYGRKLEYIGLGIEALSGAVFMVATAHNINCRRAINGAVKIYNQKY